MESVESDATDSSEQSSRPVCFRPSRSRERRYRKTSISSYKTRQISTHTTTSNQDKMMEMKEILKRPSETLYDLKIKSEELTSRRISSPVPIYSLVKIESTEQDDETYRKRGRKLSPSVIIREPSGHVRRMSNPTSSSTHATRTSASGSDVEEFSSTTSIRREKSELSQIISQILLPKTRGMKGTFANFRRWLYDGQHNTYCGRTCRSWLYIILYGIMYLIFQMTFTLFWLYISLLVINKTDRWPDIDKLDLQTFAQNGVGLSAVPASEGSLPLIWYKMGDPNHYKTYIDAIDFLFKSRTQNDTELKSLGPCSQSPYGYGEAPCILVRINKQLGWAANALLPNSTLTASAPPDVKKWVQTKQMLWLHCDGYNQYDREHINKIVYYPDPPGINPNVFPLNMDKDSPLIGVQLQGFTKGMSIGIQCKLWYDTGTSEVEFVIYVLPDDVASAQRALGKVC